jgi:hypothetical protein
MKTILGHLLIYKVIKLLKNVFHSCHNRFHEQRKDLELYT